MARRALTLTKERMILMMRMKTMRRMMTKKRYLMQKMLSLMIS